MARKKKTASVESTVASESSLSKAREVMKGLGIDEHIVPLDANSLTESKPHITTGSIAIDRAIGGPRNRFGVIPCPGWPKGGVINLYGHEASGKTTLALETAAAVCAAGGTVGFLDWEYAVAVDYAAQIGVPVADKDRFMLYQPPTLEMGLKFLWACTEKGSGVDLLICDSVSAGVPEKWVDEDIETKGELGRLGLVAAKWSRVLPQLKARVAANGSVLIGISQLRLGSLMGPPGQGPSYTAAGGKVWGFMSDLRVMLRKTKTRKEPVLNPITNKVEEKGTVNEVLCKLDKCKVSASQGAVQIFYIRLGEGIDNLLTAIEILSSRKIIIQAGSWYTLPLPGEDTVIKAQGYSRFREALEANPEAKAFIFAKAHELLYES